MKQILLFLIVCPHFLWGQVTFDDFFEAKTLRVDFTLAGNSEETNAYLSQLIEEPHWGGRQAHLDTSLRLGDFLLLLKDAETKATIYEEGFATLFEEWQNTEEATQIQRSLPNSMVMPYPKVKAQLYILKRYQGLFVDTLLNVLIVPNGKEIVKATLPRFQVDTLVHNRQPKNALDIVVLAEGFKAEEMSEFGKLSNELAKTLLTSKAFAENKERINIYAVSTVSVDSGVDSPSQDEWKDSYFNASFNTLYSERYLMVKDIQKVRDAAALVPYDQIYIIINTEKYGGGGIYNFYSTCSAYGLSNQEVLIHEFGHGLAALADEYYYDDNMLIDYVDTTREPWQKNITTLVDLERKWGAMLEENTPVPTPEDDADKYALGVYEGAAYVSKGVYRSSMDCRMKTNTAKDFCPVCEQSILEVLDFLTK
jgi:hypothetical protein